MKVYKLTDEKGQTYNDCQWGEGISHESMGNGNKLCSDGIIHCYKDPLIAVFANPHHANFDEDTMQLWEAEVEEVIIQDALKLGVKKLTTLRRIDLPRISLAARVHCAILCALKVNQAPAFVDWAEAWLLGENRSAAAAEAEAAEAAAAAWAAAAAAVAAWAAAAAKAAAAAEAAVAAWAAAAAAAAWAAEAAAREAGSLEVLQLLKIAIKKEQDPIKCQKIVPKTP